MYFEICFNLLTGQTQNMAWEHVTEISRQFPPFDPMDHQTLPILVQNL